MKILSFLLIVLTSTNLVCANANEELKKLNVKPSFYYETPYNHQFFEIISEAKVIEAGLVYKASETDFVVFSSNHHFLLNGEKASMFGTAYQLFTSPVFVESIRSDFKMNSNNEAAIFQDLLYIVDQRSSWTNFFKQGNDWFFIRKTFFDDIEAWKVSVDTHGSITGIEYSGQMQVNIPDEVTEIQFPSMSYDELEDFELSGVQIQQIKALINEKTEYNESASELTSENLLSISDASFYQFSFTLEEEVNDDEYGSYTSTHNQVFEALVFNGELHLYPGFAELLESPVFIESLKSTFMLKEKSDASVFEAMLDEYISYTRSVKDIFFENNVWYFVRGNWFDSKLGFAVEVDDKGKIQKISHSHELDIFIPEEEFDEATADWGFRLLMPESSSIEVVEGTPINYVVEFNEKPVTQMGAWIYASLNNENLDMYFGNEIYSPHYGDIRCEELPIGKHTLDIYLMRPGNDTETALDKASVEINVVPFNDEGVVWDFVMTEPKSNTVKCKDSESVPVAFSFNADEANRLGVKLEIYFEGEMVGGQNAPRHRSPFQIDIPGNEMKKGTNKVEFVFAGGTKTLAKFEVNVEVE